MRLHANVEHVHPVASSPEERLARLNLGTAEDDWTNGLLEGSKAEEKRQTAVLKALAEELAQWELALVSSLVKSLCCRLLRLALQFDSLSILRLHDCG